MRTYRITYWVDGFNGEGWESFEDIMAASDAAAEAMLLRWLKDAGRRRAEVKFERIRLLKAREGQ